MGAVKDLDYLEKEISLSLYFRAIAHPARVKIITQLYDEKKACRNIDLTKFLNLSRTTVKNHLDMMKEAGILTITYFPHHYEITLNDRGMRFAEIALGVTN